MTVTKIQIDRNQNTVDTNYTWQVGIGNDHAFQLHRTDVCQHIKMVHDELGIKYLRCHGLFDDDMLTYQRLGDYRMFGAVPRKNRIEEINFHQVGHVLDNLLESGMKPFVELSFMPSALASGKKVGLRYNNNITMPKSLKKWFQYLELFFRFILERYGEGEVESWYFEVWNEPDLSCFFSGKKEDYFRLYECTARTVKKINPKFRVGGPSTSGCLWLDDFTVYCEKNKVPCDFVTTHHYPGDAFGNMITAKSAMDMMKTVKEAIKSNTPLGETLGKMFFHPEVYKKWNKGILTIMDDEAKKKVGEKPLFITEWNSMAVFASAVHDEKFSAAFLIKTCMDLNGAADAYMFWCCSDVYEEQFMLGKTFVGGFGLVSNDGIPKPNFWAFKILAQLYTKRLEMPFRTNEDVEYAAFVNGGKTQVLVYMQDQDYYKKEKKEIEIQVNCVAEQVHAQWINDTHCNPKAEWVALGKPDYLTKAQVDNIKEKTRLKSEPFAFQTDLENTIIRLTMNTNEVVLLTLE